MAGSSKLDGFVYPGVWIAADRCGDAGRRTSKGPGFGDIRDVAHLASRRDGARSLRRAKTGTIGVMIADISNPCTGGPVIRVMTGALIVRERSGASRRPAARVTA